MASSVSEFRAKCKPAPLIPVTMPGTDLVIDCRRPDIFTLAVKGLVSWPTMARLRDLTAPVAPVDPALDNRPQPSPIDTAKSLGDFIDEYVCAAAIAPRVVLLQVDAGPDALWVQELPLEGRLAIWAETSKETPSAVTSFRGDESAGAAGGPGGAAVRDTPVDPAEGQG